MLGQRLFQIGTVALAFSVLGLVVAAALARTDGHLTYTLDDPYIHLAVAESILRGGYGVNFPQFSAPSSSVLYPYLLAALLWLGAGDWSPLILGAFGAGLASWVLAGLFWRAVAVQGHTKTILLALACAVPLVLIVSAAALPMTGMEHSLHIAATVAIIAGISQLSRDHPVPGWLVIALIVAPLIRYEGLALTGVSVLALLWYRKWADAAVVSLVVAVVIGAFTYMLLQNGMPPLPSSVAVKSAGAAEVVGAAARETSLLDSIGHGLERGLSIDAGILFSVSLVLFAFAAASRAPGSEHRIVLGLCVSASVLAHAAVGDYGWFFRYEIYLNAMVVAALLVVYSRVLRDVSDRYFFKALAIVLALTLVAADPLRAVVKTPPASANIYGQHYQMHRFATEYLPRPVAVNDLGYVAYQNDLFVLDLWGLGNDEARRLTHKDGGPAPEDLALLAARSGVGYAMIYTDWFTNGVPDAWCRIAVMTTTPRVTSALATVDFYLIDPLVRTDMMAALDAFAPSLPSGTSLDRFACD